MTHPSPDTSLRDLYDQHQGKLTDRWSLYLEIYDRLFSPVRGEPVNLLEIGIQNGGSLEIWSRYFPNFSNIVGCDINERCRVLNYEDPRIHVVIGDANAPQVEQEIARICPDFDIVIDDGSHRSGDIITAFKHYLPRLRDGGLFIAEDLHCSYWPEFQGGLFEPVSSMSFFKDLADIVNYQFWRNTAAPSALLQRFTRTYGLDFDDGLLQEIQSVQFYNSVCVIRRDKRLRNRLGTRISGGTLEQVVEGLSILNASDPSSTLNLGATSSELQHPFDSIDLLTQKLAGCKTEAAEREQHWQVQGRKHESQLLRLQQQLVERDRSIQGLDQQLSLRESELLDTRNALKLASEKVAGLLQSNSWRVTAPIRYVSTRRQQFNRLVAAARSFARARGGAAPAFAELRQRVRTHGLGTNLGLVNRYKNGQVPGSPHAGQPGMYESWIKRQEIRDARALGELPDNAEAASDWPLISVVMPTYNTPEDFLRSALDSVLAQTYPKWELCIADDASRLEHVRSVLEEYRQRDKRIKVVYRKENGHISAASNSAIELVTGEFIALLDHDDLLHPMALFWVARESRRVPTADVIFTDEDKVSEQGVRSSPLFKGDFNYPLLLGQNSVSHLGVYRTSLVRELGGLRVGYEGSQDWDLILRAMEVTGRDRILHIPLVLYHWRIHPESTASTADSKPYAFIASQKAIRSHLERMNIQAEVAPSRLLPIMTRVSYRLPETQPTVDIIIPTRDKLELVRTCIDSILSKSTYQNYSIVLVDNGSTEPESLDQFNQYSKHERIRVIRDDSPFNYSALNNSAVRESNADFVCLLNNDIEVISPDWLEEMVSQAIQPKVGCVGARLWYPDRTLQHGGVIISENCIAFHAHRHFPMGNSGYYGWMVMTREMMAVTGACLLVRRSIYEELGGLEEKLSVAYNDVDFCLRAREAGYHNIWTPFADLFHHESASRGADENPALLEGKASRLLSEQIFMRNRWGKSLKRDRFYSPNLTQQSADYQIASLSELRDSDPIE